MDHVLAVCVIERFSHLANDRHDALGLERRAQRQNVFEGPALDEFHHNAASLRPRVHCALEVSDERSEEHTSELQSPCNLVCRLLLEKKKNNPYPNPPPPIRSRTRVRTRRRTR